MTEKKLYMVIERFKDGGALPVYRRFRDSGRMQPPGLLYVSSWIDDRHWVCYQIMETDDPSKLEQWIAHWEDLMDFEVHPVISSPEAFEKVRPLL
jgi:hypothetical protein